MTTAYTKCVLEPNPSGVNVSSFMSDVIESLEAELMFLRRWCMCPIAVAGINLKCLLIACSVRPGEVVRWPVLTACRSADFVGLNIACASS
jgi:hypothetical protein